MCAFRTRCLKARLASLHDRNFLEGQRASGNPRGELKGKGWSQAGFRRLGPGSCFSLDHCRELIHWAVARPTLCEALSTWSCGPSVPRGIYKIPGSGDLTGPLGMDWDAWIS